MSLFDEKNIIRTDGDIIEDAAKELNADGVEIRNGLKEKAESTAADAAAEAGNAAEDAEAESSAAAAETAAAESAAENAAGNAAEDAPGKEEASHGLDKESERRIRALQGPRSCDAQLLGCASVPLPS